MVLAGGSTVTSVMALKPHFRRILETMTDLSRDLVVREDYYNFHGTLVDIRI